MSYSTTVIFDDQLVECRGSSGLVEHVRWDDLQTVVVRTTADGPFGVDMFWILAGRAGGCVVPAEAAGESELLERLQKLPGFDNQVLIDAMSCVVEHDFVCWKRNAQS